MTTTKPVYSPIERAMRQAGGVEALRRLSSQEKARLYYRWVQWARPSQLPPPGDWVTWLILAGRGEGKTRRGSETIRLWLPEMQTGQIALVGRTPADVRDVMIEGESGLMRVFPSNERPLYEPSKRRVTFHNGAIATVFSSENPDQLRGPSHERAWVDELATFKSVAAWDNLQLSLRLGRPKQIVTTTPRPVRTIRELVEDAESGSGRTVLTRGTSYDNRSNLASNFFEQIIRRYEGTRLGQQELEGKLLDDVEGALWQRALINYAPAPDLVRVVVGVDPSVSDGQNAAECGIVVAGAGVDGNYYILEDGSIRASPNVWANRVVGMFSRWPVDRVIAEENQGGTMVKLTLQTVDPNVPYRGVHASVGKQARAEPIAALYEQGRVFHTKPFEDLEDQLVSWVPGEGESPDRLDACLVAGTLVATDNGELAIEHIRPGQRVRTRNGYEPVLWAGMTSHMAPVYKVEFSDGRVLIGTENHPIWVKAVCGFKPLNALVWGDIIDTCETRYTSTESPTGGVKVGVITQPHEVLAKKTSIGKSGGQPTGPFPKAASFTMWTIIRRIMTSPIYNLCLDTNMRLSTLENVMRPVRHGLTRFVHSRRFGMPLGRVVNGIRTMQNNLGPRLRRWIWDSANHVAKAFRVISLTNGFAAKPAHGGLLMEPSGIPCRFHVQSVVLSSDRVNIEPNPKHAPVFVVRVSAIGEAPVYNLQVDGLPEFYANGILTHNCVWALYELAMRPAWTVI